VHEEKDCSAEMEKCDDATRVELTQADLCNLKFSPKRSEQMWENVLKQNKLQQIYSSPALYRVFN
jgi:hypothetical protein